MDPRTPVLVGVGIAARREDDPTRALEPIELILVAIRNAAGGTNFLPRDPTHGSIPSNPSMMSFAGTSVPTQ